MEETKDINTGQDLQGVATHSGWAHFHVLFSKYRDECLKVGQIVFGTNTEIALKYITPYHSSLYSMAQQIFSFYDASIEKEITKKWLELSLDINEILYFVSDKDFRRQMVTEGKEIIPKELKVKLLMFFNRLDRLAAEAGLLVGKENKGSCEPKKGLVGFRK
jgi:hypothetical protein